MNTELLRQVADLIEREDRFDLNVYAGVRAEPVAGTGVIYSSDRMASTLLANDGQMDPDIECGAKLDTCQTVGCVAGWTNALTGNFNASDWMDAALALGIDPDRAQDQLFYADGGSVWARVADRFGWDVRASDEEYPGLNGWHQITAVQAAKVLRMIADGEVDL